MSDGAEHEDYLASLRADNAASAERGDHSCCLDSGDDPTIPDGGRAALLRFRIALRRHEFVPDIGIGDEVQLHGMLEPERWLPVIGLRREHVEVEFPSGEHRWFLLDAVADRRYGS